MPTKNLLDEVAREVVNRIDLQVIHLRESIGDWPGMEEVSNRATLNLIRKAVQGDDRSFTEVVQLALSQPDTGEPNPVVHLIDIVLGEQAAAVAPGNQPTAPNPQVGGG